jgi:D-alanine transaminase
MTVPMNDRAGYFGDGIYDANYSRNHIIYALDEHIDRFFNSARAVGMDVPMSKEALSSLLCDLVRRVDDGEQFVYWQATRGSALRDHTFPKGEIKSNLMIMLRPISIKPVYEPIRLISAEDKRYLYCNVKTLNLLPSVLTAEMAAKAGADETVLHRGDRVTECSHSNVSILKNGAFITPPADEYILPGVGRAHLIAASKTLGIPVEERIFTMDELRDADEIIVSSAGSLCLSARELDGKPVGGKDPVTLRKLQDFVVADWLAKTEG